VNNGQGKIRGKVNIFERPAGAAGRAVPGHWEADIIFGTRRSAIATLAGRRSRFVMLLALPRGHGAESVTGARRQAITALPAQLRRSLTRDQGTEMAGHARVQRGHRCPGVLLRPAQPLAAGQQPEHQRSAAPVLPPQHRLHGGYPK
jgi:IS30 family transposase